MKGFSKFIALDIIYKSDNVRSSGYHGDGMFQFTKNMVKCLEFNDKKIGFYGLLPMKQKEMVDSKFIKHWENKMHSLVKGFIEEISTICQAGTNFEYNHIIAICLQYSNTTPPTFQKIRQEALDGTQWCQYIATETA